MGRLLGNRRKLRARGGGVHEPERCSVLGRRNGGPVLGAERWHRKLGAVMPGGHRHGSAEGRASRAVPGRQGYRDARRRQEAAVSDQHDAGFTLVELLVVIVIMGAVMGAIS